MTHNNFVIYLERDPYDNRLKFPSNIFSNEIEYYQVGGLYINVQSSPSEIYKIRAYFGDSIVFDILYLVTVIQEGLYIYRLGITQSEIRNRLEVYFAVERTNEFAPEFDTLWRVNELNPEYLDKLEQDNDYNLIGVTNISNPEFANKNVDVDPQGLTKQTKRKMIEDEKDEPLGGTISGFA
jgi:hypothetical protein